MEKKEYLRMLVEDIHSTVIATVDEEGKPVTRVIDMMLYDEDSVYFLTARGKQFYTQLMEQNYVSITGVKNGKSISVNGYTLNIGHTKLDEIFEKNEYMQSIYPSDTRDALEVFRVYKGEGNYFDISDPKHISRGTFILGDEEETGFSGYYVTDLCILCGTCFAVCPQQCIDTAKNPVVIDQNHCLHCGRCFENCPVNAIIKK